MRKLALQATRNGYFFTLDRITGEHLVTVKFSQAANWAMGLDKNGAPKRDPSKDATIPGSLVSPTNAGTTNWFPPAYDPELGLFFVGVNQWGMGLTAWEKGKLQYKPGDLFMGVDYQMYRMGETIGHIKAIDVANKKVAWDVTSPLPVFSGMLVTKGGVLFTGDQRGRLLALEAKTGKELWKFQTGSGINASPITYELDGKQYVAILSGLGGDPSFYYSAPKGGMLWVFAIDGKVDEGGAYNAQVIEKMLPEFKQ